MLLLVWWLHFISTYLLVNVQQYGFKRSLLIEMLVSVTAKCYFYISIYLLVNVQQYGFKRSLMIEMLVSVTVKCSFYPYSCYIFFQAELIS